MTLPVYADSLSRRLFYLLTIILLIKLGLDFIHLSDSRRIQFPGDHLPGVPPVPIPNTAVKPRAANGSRALGPARVGYCQVYDPDSAKAGSGSSYFRLSQSRRETPLVFSTGRFQSNRDYIFNDDIQTLVELAGLIH
jgi:hypothetical protein